MHSMDWGVHVRRPDWRRLWREMVVLAAVLALVLVAGLLVTRVPAASGPDRWFAAHVANARSTVATTWMKAIAGADSKGALTALVTLAVAVAIWWRSNRSFAVAFVGAGAFGQLVGRVFQLVVQRPRPPDALVPLPPFFSYPSGHAIGSAIFFGLLALLALRLRARWAAWLVAAFCLTAALAAGLSRLYLGVHWLTDVLAGWVVATAVVLVTADLLGETLKQHPRAKGRPGRQVPPTRRERKNAVAGLRVVKSQHMNI